MKIHLPFAAVLAAPVLLSSSMVSGKAVDSDSSSFLRFAKRQAVDGEPRGLAIVDNVLCDGDDDSTNDCYDSNYYDYELVSYDPECTGSCTYTYKFQDCNNLDDNPNQDLSHWNIILNSKCNIDAPPSCTTDGTGGVITEIGDGVCNNPVTGESLKDKLYVAKCNLDGDPDPSGTMTFTVTNVIDADGGTALAQSKPGQNCASSAPSCHLLGPTCGDGTQQVCGDGVLQGDETCELVNEEYVDSLGNVVSNCRPIGETGECTYCGDSTLNGPETCDPTVEGAPVNCRSVGDGDECTYCGDGIVQSAVESCEPSQGGCTDVCAFDATSCPTECDTASDPVIAFTPDEVGDLTLACIDLTPGTPASSVTSCDTSLDGSPATFTESDGRDNSCGTGTITRTWSATDCKGRTTTKVQTITFTDDSDPVLNIPANATVPCDSTSPTGQATATDNCQGTPSVTFSDPDDKPTCGTFGRTWTATDCSFRTASGVQDITVQDNDPPTVATGESTLTLSCGAPMPVNPFTFEDNCASSIEVTGPDESESELTGTCFAGKVVRKWTLDDGCENTAIASQTVTFESQSPPALTFVDNEIETVDCDKNQASLPFGTPSATDDCDTAVTIISSDADNRGTCPTGSVTRTWTATSCDGGSSTESQTITVVDNVVPTFNPETLTDASSFCDPANPGAPLDFMLVTASDTCDPNVMLTFSDTCTDTSGGAIFTRTWTAKDCSGNTATIDQSITQLDKCLFTIGEAFSGQAVQVEFDITDTAPAAAKIVVTIVDPNFVGDMRGVFLNLKPSVAATLDKNIITATLLDGTSKSNDILGEVKIEEDGVVRVKNDVNMNGGGDVYDIGIELGTQGLSKDDIRSVEIIIPDLAVEDIEGEAGVRLTSVGVEGGSRGDSSKTTGDASCCTPSCPAAECGNGYVDENEECDKGVENGAQGSGCGSDCKNVAPEPSCTASDDNCCPVAAADCATACTGYTCPVSPPVCDEGCVCSDATSVAACSTRRGLGANLFG